jgi:hypothetical protein
MLSWPAEVSVPHVGWQFVPLTVSIQLVPALDVSFSTLAAKKMLEPPAKTLVTLF